MRVTGKMDTRATGLDSTSIPHQPSCPGDSGPDLTVCHPVWRLASGGLERQLVQTVNAMTGVRHIVIVRGWNAESEALAAALREDVVLIKDREQRGDRAFARRLAAMLNTHRVDVLHVRGLSMLVDSVVAADVYGEAKPVFSFHGFEAPDIELGGIRRKVFREAMLRCRDRWAVSRSAADAIGKQVNLSPELFGVVPNGVDLRWYSPGENRAAIRDDLGLPQDRCVILSAGNFKPIKQHHILLESLAASHQLADQVTVLLAGRDYLGGRLQRWAASHLSEFDVRFVGEQANLLPWYRAADVFALPSAWEGSSNALLEAMACGLPVAATRVGGTSEVIEHGENGMLVIPGDVKDMAATLVELVGDPALRDRLSQAAIKRVRSRYDHGVTMRVCEERYRAALQFEDEEDAVPAAEAVMA